MGGGQLSATDLLAEPPGATVDQRVVISPRRNQCDRHRSEAGGLMAEDQVFSIISQHLSQRADTPPDRKTRPSEEHSPGANGRPSRVTTRWTDVLCRFRQRHPALRAADGDGCFLLAALKARKLWCVRTSKDEEDKQRRRRSPTDAPSVSPVDSFQIRSILSFCERADLLIRTKASSARSPSNNMLNQRHFVA